MFQHFFNQTFYFRGSEILLIFDIDSSEYGIVKEISFCYLFFHVISPIKPFSSLFYSFLLRVFSHFLSSKENSMTNSVISWRKMHWKICPGGISFLLVAKFKRTDTRQQILSILDFELKMDSGTHLGYRPAWHLTGRLIWNVFITYQWQTLLKGKYSLSLILFEHVVVLIKCKHY